MNKLIENELVSVIIPIYNSEDFISMTLESILSQTYESIEIILIDDCSTDNSEEIIKSYVNKHQNIHYHQLEKNSGAAIARNRGIEIAKGKYIAFLDSDDLWVKNKLEKQVSLMKQHNYPFTFSAYGFIDEYAKKFDKAYYPKEKVSYQDLLKTNYIGTSTVVIEKELMLKHLMRGKIFEDYLSWIMIIEECGLGIGIQEVLTYYRIRKNSLSRNKVKLVKDFWEVFTKDLKIKPLMSSYYLL